MKREVKNKLALSWQSKQFFSLIASPFRILEPSDFQSRCEVFALLSLRIFLLTRNQPLLWATSFEILSQAFFSFTIS
jgi:hypothetical protein